MTDQRRLPRVGLGYALLLCVACSGEETGRRGGPIDDPSNNDGVVTADADADGDGTGDGTGVGPKDMAEEMTPMAPLEESCGEDCFENIAGGDGATFDVGENGEGVALDEEGALILTGGSGSGSKYIWIANTSLSTVTKINVDTFMPEARYAVGSPDPSRSSVNLQGDVFVGSRGGSGITRVSSLGADCPDTNGDGVVTTSSGITDVLAYGQDDCVLWYTALAPAGKVRGVAAQDIPAKTMIEPQLDGPPKITVEPAEHYVWVGTNNNGAPSDLWKLDAETGAVLLHMVPPTPVYGLAMSGEGILYTTGGYYGNNIGWVDTAQCVDDASCAVAPCAVTCTVGSCPDTCDGSTIGRVDLGGAGNGNAYGITVDCKQRVWLGGYSGNDIRRYDPSAPANMRLGVAAGTKGVNGIGADRDGWVWGSTGNSVIRVHAETLTSTTVATASKGIGIDSNGMVWSVPQGDTVSVIDPGPGMADAVIVTTVSGQGNPYTYSDMTGEQLRLATNEPGNYRQRFEGCSGDSKPTDWAELIYEAELPDGAWVVFRIRGADTDKGLNDADWVDLVAAPGVDSPVDLESYLEAAGIAGKKHMEVEVELLADSPGAAPDGCSGAENGITPRVKKFGLRHRCMPDLM